MRHKAKAEGTGAGVYAPGFGVRFVGQKAEAPPSQNAMADRQGEGIAD